MAHPIVYGLKTLDLIAPTIDVTTGSTKGLNITGAITTPTIYGNTVATPQFVTISPTGSMGSEPIPPSGVLTLGAVDTHPNANAALITGTTLQMEPASSSFPGVITTGNQSFAGTKVFTGPISTNSSVGVGTTITDSAGDVLLSYSGTTNPQSITLGSAITTQLNANGIYGNSPSSPQGVTINSAGVLGSQSLPAAVSIAAFGSSPTANAATVSSNAITFQPADSTHPGAVTTGTQAFGGKKIFTNIQFNTTTSTLISQGGQSIVWQGEAGDQGSFFGAQNTGQAVTSGTNLVGIGNGALNSLQSGTNVIGIGNGAGSAYTSSESNDICLGNAGVIADSGAIRIGTNATHTSCFVQGISGVSPASPQMVTIGTGGQLGSQSLPVAVSIATFGSSPTANAATVSSNAITFQPADATHPGSLTTAAQSIAGTKTFTSPVQVTGSLQDTAANVLLSYSGTTNPQTITLGNANTTIVNTNGISGVTPGGTPQMVTIGTGGQLGSTATPAAVSIATFGSSPTANGATVSSNAITLQPADGTHPGAISTAAQTMGSGVKTFTSAPLFSAGATLASGQKILHSDGTSTLLWNGAFNEVGSVFAGNSSGATTTTTSQNLVGIGNGALQYCTNGIRCVAVGTNALQNWLGTGGVGYNTCLGFAAGGAYNGTESANIIINNGSGNLGVVGDNNITRIGASQSACYISGISGVTSAGGVAAVINASGQFGTVVSSKKYKKDIQKIENNPILDLECVSFRYISDKTNELHYGFIAEKVLPLIPEAIVFEKEMDIDNKVIYNERGEVKLSTTDPETIQYHKLWPLMQDMMVKMNQRIVSLESELEDLTGRPLKRGRPSEMSERPNKRVRTQ